LIVAPALKAYAGARREEEFQSMAIPGRRPSWIARWLAAIALVLFYSLTSMGVLVGVGAGPAAAHPRGVFRGRGFRGFRGRGRGFGIYLGAPYYGPYYDYDYDYGYRCYWSRRWHRRICPY
jgi:hypothetical protein